MSDEVGTRNQEFQKVIDLYYSQPKILYNHLFSSYEKFIDEIIYDTLMKDPSYFHENIIGDKSYKHGFVYEDVFFKPASIDNDNELMYPHYARKNHLNYFGTLTASVKQIVDILNLSTEEVIRKDIGTVEKDIHIAKIPIMVGSRYCTTNIKKESIQHECRFDPGGYFIVKGQEKIIMSIEKMVDNKILVFTKKDPTMPTGTTIVAQVNSKRYDHSDYIQILNLRMKKDLSISINMSQVVDIPLFVLLRALGLESDKDIIQWITYDLKDEGMINTLRNSMIASLDENKFEIKTKEQAYEYIARKVKRLRRIINLTDQVSLYQKKIYLNKLLRNDILPHLGDNLVKKAKYICLMVNSLLKVYLNRELPDDRDSISNKRIETAGILLGQLFKQNYKKMINECGKVFKKKYNSDENPMNIISLIKYTIIEQGLKTGLSTGAWGVNKSKKGVAQSLQRLSWMQATSYLRRVMAPSMDESTSAVISIRHVNNLQFGFLCLTGDTEVLQSDGVTTKLIKDMNNGDKVYTVGKDLSNEPSEIYNWFSKMPDELLEITTISGRKLKLTPEHPLLIKQEDGTFEMIKASNMKEGDLCVVKHIFSNDEKTLSNIEIEYSKYILHNSKINMNINEFTTLYRQTDEFVTIPIESIKNIEPELVYDFTTKSENHSFVASSIISSNCVSETPEGAKIGIVKSLSQTSNVTLQLDSQIRIISDYIKETKLVTDVNDLNPFTVKDLVYVFLNGNWLGCTTNDKSIILNDYLLQKKLEHYIHKTVCITLNYSKKQLQIFSDGGRMYRPLIRVENNKTFITDEIIEELRNNELKQTIDKLTWNQFLIKYPNIIDYLDVESSNNALIAFDTSYMNESEEAKHSKIEYSSDTKIDRYGKYRYLKYTHCEIHPSFLLGTIAACIPYANHNQAVKNIVNFSQSKHAMGIYLTSYKDRMDISQILYNTQRPLVYTDMMFHNNSWDLPAGQNSIVAILSYTGYNQEDSLILNQSAIDRGFMRAETLKKYTSAITKNPSTSQDDIFTQPDKNKVTGMRGNYDKLNSTGFVEEETPIVKDDIIIGKISPIQPVDSNKVYKDNSEIYKAFVPGVIDRVHNGIYDASHSELYNVKVRSERVPVCGDKFACYTPDHDILTTDGWIPINKVTTEHKVASLVDGNRLKYVHPTEVQSYDYEGKMYQVDSNQIKLTVTPNHRMYVRTRIKAYGIEKAEDILHQRRYYKKNVEKYKPHRMKTFTLPAYGTRQEHILDMDAWLMLVGIWYAEGCSYETYVVIAAHKERVREALVECCKTLHLKISEQKDHVDDDVRVSWRFHNQQLAQFFRPLSVGSINKSLPDWCWKLRPDQCRILLHGMMLGDGSTMDNGTRRYTTSSTKLADDFQRLCLHAGWSSNKLVKSLAGTQSVCKTRHGKEHHEVITQTVDHYTLTIIETQNEPLVNKNIKKIKSTEKDVLDVVSGELDGMVDYKGKVYCCTVQSGIVYVRNKGYGVWCGNSRHSQKGTIGLILQQKDMPFTKDGIVPDFILNPHAIPTRMTVAQLNECMASKIGALTGSYFDGTPFNNYDVRQLPKMLQDLGYNSMGLEDMYCGMTGKKMEAQVFIGPTYYMRLKHMVQDKVHCLTMDHEVLTESGWKFFNDITMNDKIATLKDDELAYDKPIKLLHYPDYKGKMITVKNEHIDLNVTANHRMYVDIGTYHDFINDELVKKDYGTGFELIEASKLSGYQQVKYKKLNGNIINTYGIITENSTYSTESTEVFCLEVPSEIFCVRRNGKDVWTGNSRARGPRQALTRQPLEGRSKDGGLKIGEMEKDAIVAHGMGQFLKERFMETSDLHSAHVCDDCGLFVSKMMNKDYYMCKACKNNIRISKVNIPYAFKLLVQELMSVNIAPRIVTERSIFSDAV
jgi:DNA-directed RNA polymerase beta subunit